MTVKTRAGVIPAEQPLTFEITTTKAEEFLQQRLNQYLEMVAKKEGRTADLVKIRLISNKMSRQFVPFAVILSPTVLKNRGGKKNNDVLSIFDVNDDDDFVNIRTDVYNFFRIYAFTKDDVNGFFSNTFKKELDLRPNTPHIIKQYAKPKVLQLDSKKLDKRYDERPIIWILDPYRIFKEMITNPEAPDEKFTIKIEREKKELSDTNFLYSVTKFTAGKGKRSKDERVWEKEIAHILRTSKY